MGERPFVLVLVGCVGGRGREGEARCGGEVERGKTTPQHHHKQKIEVSEDQFTKKDPFSRVSGGCSVASCMDWVEIPLNKMLLFLEGGFL